MDQNLNDTSLTIGRIYLHNNKSIYDHHRKPQLDRFAPINQSSSNKLSLRMPIDVIVDKCQNFTWILTTKQISELYWE